MVAIWHHIINSFNVLAQKGYSQTCISWVKGSSERLTGVKMSFHGWMSDIWAARDEQPIRPTTTHPCMALRGLKLE